MPPAETAPDGPPAGRSAEPAAGPPVDYAERVYAGVLGKIIAVCLGRPFEGWSHQKILDELGEITCYVNDRHDVALKHHLLVVPDDDISGTFVFPRSLRDHGLDPTPEQVGQTWLNELIEDKTVLWWGGLGNSTEHTAYLRLLAGETPPDTGSAARNGVVVSEQVGAQIFIEGFAMTCPGDPEKAADLAERAAGVSHDGEALHAARVVAALVAYAFTEPDMGRLLDTATSLIPKGSLIHQVIDDVRGWCAEDADWRHTRQRIDDRHGYHRYGGNCHVVPNHATVIHALARSDGDFHRAMTVVASSGWDTDSNAGNVGAVAGVRGGLDGLTSGPDWRGPIADRMYLPSADGGSAITDAAREALTLVDHGRARHGLSPATPPKNGARFHFTLPGSVQGFTVDDPAAAYVSNEAGALAIRCPNGADAAPVCATTPTFIPPEALGPQIYGLRATPTLYPGQHLIAAVSADPGNAVAITCRLLIRHYDGMDQLASATGPLRALAPGASDTLHWQVPDLGGQPVAAVGLTIEPVAGEVARNPDHARPGGAVHLNHLTWTGEPAVTLSRPVDGGGTWRRAWVDAVDRWDDRWPEPFRIVQNRGSGMLIHGTRQWRDYQVTADVTPHLAEAVGIAARVQGLKRHYALRLVGRDTVRLERRLHGAATILASRPFPWQYGTTYQLALRVVGGALHADIDDEPVLSVEDPDPSLDSGGVALLVTAGRTATTAVRIGP